MLHNNGVNLFVYFTLKKAKLAQYTKYQILN